MSDAPIPAASPNHGISKFLGIPTQRLSDPSMGVQFKHSERLPFRLFVLAAKHAHFARVYGSGSGLHKASSKGAQPS